MKKLVAFTTAALFSLSLFATEPVAVSQKVLNAFEQSFKNVSNASWSQFRDGYEVRFLNNNIDSRITYDSNGTVMSIMRYYTEETLPLIVRAKLQEKYAGKTVFGVTEMWADNHVDYYIVLEDATTWKHVKCSANGDMETIKKYKKA